jgi:transcriptional regulator with XRE-family HTH domain
MPAPGPAGRDLVANVERLRREHGLSERKLSSMLEAAGRPIPPLGLARIRRLQRRVDVDELAALAEVLGVTPDELLAPPGTSKPAIDHAAVRAAQDLTARIGQLLEADGDPATVRALCGYVDRAVRRAALEVEELLTERRTGGTA